MTQKLNIDKAYSDTVDIRPAANNYAFVVAEGQAMKEMTGGQPGGESSPNPFLLLWSYRRAGNCTYSRF